MKKLICAVLVFLLIAASFTACDDNIDNTIDHTENAALQNEKESKNDSSNSKNQEAVNIDMKTVFEQVYAGTRRILKDGEQMNLGDCTGYSGKTIEYLENQVAYIDFDGDGFIEALVQSGADGEHILHYDFARNAVYATFISPRGGCVYFANGELAHNYDDDNIRQKIVKFDNGKIELEEVSYTGAIPNREKPEWSYIVIKTPAKG